MHPAEKIHNTILTNLNRTIKTLSTIKIPSPVIKHAIGDHPERVYKKAPLNTLIKNIGMRTAILIIRDDIISIFLSLKYIFTTELLPLSGVQNSNYHI